MKNEHDANQAMSRVEPSRHLYQNKPYTRAVETDLKALFEKVRDQMRREQIPDMFERAPQWWLDVNNAEQK